MATAAQRKAERARLRRETSAVEAATHDGSTEEKPAAIKKSRDTVTVCCKIMNGLILQNHVLVDDVEPVFGGGFRPCKKARKVGEPIKINGPARAPGSDPDAKQVTGGYGLTFNVPKDDFEKWMHDNAELDMVRNRLIFAADSSERAKDQARDQKTIRSGLEPLNTEGRKGNGDYIDPRMPRNLKKYKPDDDSTDIRGA
jgi:hypothetical protein